MNVGDRVRVMVEDDPDPACRHFDEIGVVAMILDDGLVVVDFRSWFKGDLPSSSYRPEHLAVLA